MNRKWSGVAFYLVLLAMLLFGIFYMKPSQKSSEEISYTKLIEEIDNKQVESIDVKGSEAVVSKKGDTIVRAQIPPMVWDSFYENHLKAPVEAGEITLSATPVSEGGSTIAGFLPTFLVMLFMGYIFFSIMKSQQGAGGRMMNFGKSRARVVEEKDGKTITFDDVAGLEEEKEELSEIVEFLKNPKKFTTMGARIPKGVLLVGPPGTGKTYLSKSVAGEAKVPFYIMSGSDFVEMYVGVGASRVRDLFETAKKNAPCIIFIDEIDAVGRRRGAGLGGGHDEREQTLNQLLVEMDGFGTNEGVIVMAATNRADILDPALLRPGRFDRQIYVGLPDVRAREEILKLHGRKKPLADDVDMRIVAKRTPGFTPADLENLMNESALLAARENHKKIPMSVINEASIKVIAGPAKKSSVIQEKERKLTAVHEAGHAVVSRLLPEHDPVHMITIIPRGQAGGFTAYLPEDDILHFTTKTEMTHRLVSLLGGRVAEALVLDDISTGASNDIERATAIAREMVTKYGMSEKIGTLSYGSDSESVFLGRDLSHTKDYSEEVAAEIDEEMRRIIGEAYDKASSLLKSHMDTLLRVSDALLDRETISGKEFEILFNGGSLKADPYGSGEKIEQSELSEEAEEALEDNK
ncbi:ATP-dependent zinc metalloprotease FtsH [Aedoeadaptatus ivorii]|uniref:ATP-dependent zinc metalloprotease FtsH n=1 Tax=Aedoeadaptatus ivorii TaxID=54006 RepID=A0A3S4YKG1_9FIRM|nr:ATP-dependent zinc metalloprotease FtsH [Peptoniphilus ivorii]MDQ0509061.1 cell division protease FtsH [Peptoniphilus ivorii]VEJ35168.1 ATP-dependent zinc metalloprotease FtsH [Peptoniphilus ivorii]